MHLLFSVMRYEGHDMGYGQRRLLQEGLWTVSGGVALPRGAVIRLRPMGQEVIRQKVWKNWKKVCFFQSAVVYYMRINRKHMKI